MNEGRFYREELGGVWEDWTSHFRPAFDTGILRPWPKLIAPVINRNVGSSYFIYPTLITSEDPQHHLQGECYCFTGGETTWGKWSSQRKLVGWCQVLIAMLLQAVSIETPHQQLIIRPEVSKRHWEFLMKGSGLDFSPQRVQIRYYVRLRLYGVSWVKPHLLLFAFQSTVGSAGAQ